jgi:hypothetical protein
MPRTIGIDFYRVEPPEGVKFSDLLDKVRKLPDDKRTKALASDPIRLHTCEDVDGLVAGDMTRIRMDDLPSKASMKGAVEELNFGTDEGVGEHAAFLYDPRTKVLLLQRKPQGTTARLFATYFAEMTNLGEPLFLDPVLQADAILRLNNLREPRKFAVRVAKVDNPEVFLEAGESVKGMVDLLRTLQAPSLAFSASMGNHKGSLSLDSVKAAARRLLSFADNRQNRVKKIEIKGVDSDGETDDIDLVEERMRERVPVDDEGTRRISFETRRIALREAFGRRRDELRSMFQASENGQ